MFRLGETDVRQPVHQGTGRARVCSVRATLRLLAGAVTVDTWTATAEREKAFAFSRHGSRESGIGARLETVGRIDHVSSAICVG